MVVASLVAHALSQIALFAVQSVAAKVHSLVRLVYIMALVSNIDHDRAIANVCLSATKVCYGRYIALGFAQHSCDSCAAGDTLAPRT